MRIERKRPVPHANAAAAPPVVPLQTLPPELLLLVASDLPLRDFTSFMAIDRKTKAVLDQSPEHQAAKVAYAARKAACDGLSQTMAHAWKPAMLHEAIGQALAPIRDAKPPLPNFDRQLARNVFANVIRMTQNPFISLEASDGMAIAQQLCDLSKYVLAARPSPAAEADRQLVNAWMHLAWSAIRARRTSQISTIKTLANMVPVCANAKEQAKPWSLLKHAVKLMVKGAGNSVVKKEFKQVHAEVATLEKQFMRIRHTTPNA